MKLRVLLLFLFTIKSMISLACLGTYQFKMFPLGIYQNQIVSIDFQIQRTENSKVEMIDEELNAMFILKSFISIYDENQKLISINPMDTVLYFGEKYEDTLSKIYSKIFEYAVTKYSGIELFTIEYMSFCDFQNKCKITELVYDSITETDFLIYQKIKYPLPILSDSMFKNLSNLNDYQYLSSLNSSSLFINSIRIYKTKNKKFLFVHFGRGHELAMGWIENKEYPPKFLYNNIQKSTYIEPLLHHGFGIDCFILL